MVTWGDVVVRYYKPTNTDSDYHLAQVTIGVTEDVEEIISKQLLNLTPPTTTANMANGKQSTKSLDLLRIEERITVTGTLVTAHGTSGTFAVQGDEGRTYTERSDSSDKRDDLKGIVKAGGTFWLTWQDTTYQVNCEKLAINTVDKDGSEPGDGEIGYKVIMTVIIGVDMI